MFMRWRPASRVYHPEAGTRVEDFPINRVYKNWGYRLGRIVDANEEDVPPWGNTVIFRIFKGGMTEPVYVSKPEHNTRFKVEVLRGSGMLIRAWASGAVYPPEEMTPGNQFEITPGQSYSYVNVGRQDLVLRDEAMPAFRDGDEIKLIDINSPKQKARLAERGYPEVSRPDDRQLVIPHLFYDQVFAAAANPLNLVRQ